MLLLATFSARVLNDICRKYPARSANILCDWMLGRVVLIADFKDLASAWRAIGEEGLPPTGGLDVCHSEQVMEERGRGDRDRIRPDRCTDRGCRDCRNAAGWNQPHLDLQQRRLEALTIGDFGRLHHARVAPSVVFPCRVG